MVTSGRRARLDVLGQNELGLLQGIEDELLTPSIPQILCNHKPCGSEGPQVPKNQARMSIGK
jgi:hypothetical protein